MKIKEEIEAWKELLPAKFELTLNERETKGSYSCRIMLMEGKTAIAAIGHKSEASAKDALVKCYRSFREQLLNSFIVRQIEENAKVNGKK
jgi:hypothetical protein